MGKEKKPESRKETAEVQHVLEGVKKAVTAQEKPAVRVVNVNPFLQRNPKAPKDLVKHPSSEATSAEVSSNEGSTSSSE
jgi:hypothetical protein